jgi:hypothetical protein
MKVGKRVELVLLDCESLDNWKVRDYLFMSCHPYILLTCYCVGTLQFTR